jgi:hypothetical protein
MSFRLDRFSVLRPYLFHLTATANLRRIRRQRELRAAAGLFREAGFIEDSSKRRVDHRYLNIDGDVVMVRDQKPLHRGAIEFASHWDMARWVAHVNEHVFFWPGSAAGPIEPGLRHFERYRKEEVAVLRLPTDAVLSSAIGSRALFSRFNSGAPRVVNGRRSPRGIGTFVGASEFLGTAGDVVEVVFNGVLRLPNATVVADAYNGRWRALLEERAPNLIEETAT